MVNKSIFTWKTNESFSIYHPIYTFSTNLSFPILISPFSCNERRLDLSGFYWHSTVAFKVPLYTRLLFPIKNCNLLALIFVLTFLKRTKWKQWEPWFNIHYFNKKNVPWIFKMHVKICYILLLLKSFSQKFLELHGNVSWFLKSVANTQFNYWTKCTYTSFCVKTKTQNKMSLRKLSVVKKKNQPSH